MKTFKEFLNEKETPPTPYKVGDKVKVYDHNHGGHLKGEISKVGKIAGPNAYEGHPQYHVKFKSGDDDHEDVYHHGDIVNHYPKLPG